MSVTVKGFNVYSFTRDKLPMVEGMFEQFEFSTVGLHHSRHVGMVKDSEGNFMTILHNGDIVMTYRSQEKKVNKDELARRLAEKVTKKEIEFDRKLKKNEITALSTAITEELIPLTFPQAPKDTKVLFTKVGEQDVIIVGQGGLKACEDVTALLRKCIGSLPVVPLETNILPDELITQLVKDKHIKQTSKFTLGDKVDMVDEDGLTIKVGSGSVYAAPTEQHIEQGATVTSLKLDYDGILQFVLNDKGEFKGVKLNTDIPEFEDAEQADVKLSLEATGLIEMSYIKLLTTAMVELLDGIQE